MTCPVQRVIDEQYDRARIALKFGFEHDRRSQGQKDRQTRERIARIFRELGERYGKAQGVGDGVRHVG